MGTYFSFPIRKTQDALIAQELTTAIGPSRVTRPHADSSEGDRGVLVRVFEDKLTLSKSAAEQASTAVRRAILDRGRARIIVATGTSQLDFLDTLTSAENIDWQRVEMFHLDEPCRRQQVGEGWFANLSEVPRQAISMSVRQILKAKEIIAVVPDARKAHAVKLCLEGEISPMAPASILRTHPAATLYLDSESASLLSPATLAALAAAG